MTRSVSLVSRFVARLRPKERPPAAIAINSAGVLAASKAAGTTEIKYAFRTLPTGTVTPGVNQTNLHSAELVATTVRGALDEVCGTTRSVTLLLPDPSTRVFPLEFDTLPDNREDVLAVLRLRLKRVVPFDLETAKISYQVLLRSQSNCKILVVIVPDSILNEYESVVRDAGYAPGAVLPSALSALAAFSSDEPILSAYLNGTSLTTSITAGNDILLYRTHDLPDDDAERTAEIQRDVAVAVAYFEDELKVAPSCLHYSGNIAPEEFGHSIIKNIAITSISPHSPGIQGRFSTAALLGALAGARCA